MIIFNYIKRKINIYIFIYSIYFITLIINKLKKKVIYIIIKL